MFLALTPGSALAPRGRTVPKLAFSLGCAAGLFAAMEACSSRTADWNQPAPVAAQPTVGQPATDPNQPPGLPGCACEMSAVLNLTVTDPAGNPVSGVAFPGNKGVCIGWGSRSAAPDAGAIDAADAGEADGGADGDAGGATAPDARSADGAVDRAPDGDGVYDAAGADAADAGQGACSTWRFWITAPAKGVELTAPGYAGGTTADVPMVSSCCYSFGGVPVFDRSVVLQPLPVCPANWGPCSRDAGLRGSPTSCICP
jgi:hypothetical protein